MGLSKNHSSLWTRLTSAGKRKITIAGSEHEVLLLEHVDDSYFLVEYDGAPFEIFLGAMKAGNRLALVDGIPLVIGETTISKGTFSLQVNDKRIQAYFSRGSTLRPPVYTPQAIEASKLRLSERELSRVIAHMPGRIISIKVKVGDSIKAGDPILVLLAMKMENTIVAPSTGIVREVHVEVGITVNKGDLLAVID